MKYLGFVWRVLRRLVWETATDTTTGLAAQMAYLLLFALAPGSLFLWHLLGLFGTDPTKLHRMFLLLKSFMPPDQKVQEILDSTMANVVVTGSSGLLANAGIILGIYFGTVFIATTSRALSHTYGMREDPHWWSKYIISFFMLFWFGIIIVFCFNAIVFGERLAGLAEVNFQLAFPLQAWITTLNLPFTFVTLLTFFNDSVDRVAHSVTLRRSDALSHLAHNCVRLWRNPWKSHLCASRCRRKKPTRGVRADRGAFLAVSETKKISGPGSKSIEGQIGKKTPGSCPQCFA